MELVKRGAIYYYSDVLGGKRIRRSLGVRDPKIARSLGQKLDRAVHAGPKAPEWEDLAVLLPPKTMASFCDRRLGPARTLSNQELFRKYAAKLDRRLQLGRMASSTNRGYQNRVAAFLDWLTVHLSDCTTQTIEEYLIQRKSRLAESSLATNGRGISADYTALRSFFGFLSEEGFRSELRFPDPPKLEGEAAGAEPYAAGELDKMQAVAEGRDLMAFLLLRWTGLRRSDAVALSWSNVDLSRGTIKTRAKKNGKTVAIPLAPALQKELELWYNQGVLPQNAVLPDMTEDKLYQLVRRLGRAAGVEGASPHRFRDSLAVYLLQHNTPLFEVAKILGDTVAVVEKYYAAWVPELQDKVRAVFEREVD